MHLKSARTSLRPVKFVFAALLAAVMSASATAYAFFSASDSPVGSWKTIDDETGETKSIVKIYEVDGKIYGRVDRLLLKPGALCEACEGEDHNKPIEGMVVMWGLSADDGEWSGGKIFDPQKNKTYRCKIWLEDGGRKLKVRGYLGPFFRTQTWIRQ
ncbi:Uncharacterized conserved protein, DUF2147 family [Nannocystis exedens]|uniref:Uncharacterized conserved protein, DUF2147 family n=1 Tax=Nannocystis exedens TaxID=54 RepID=A0A1I2GGM3_9BACT|nr:DUF2147 domain-containing protein [Nannocystis exedens]PCC69981.1 hypothetical protein NAEX_03009 [Nannocystis exedens]SFF16017.1 Uncharacterized conserved protein, DUF2147 family [Nannocystis exedens]